MLKVTARLLCIFVLALLAPAALPAEIGSALPPAVFHGAQTPLDIYAPYPEYTRVELHNPPINVSEVSVFDRTYHSFELEGEPWIMQEGAPAIPRISRFMRIPNTGSVELVVQTAEYDLIENVDPLPVLLEAEMFPQMPELATAFQHDEWYPAQPAMLAGPAILRDIRVAELVLYPVQVNPVTRQARVYHDLEVELVANDEPGECELITSRRMSGSWVPIYRTMIANLDESELDEATTTPGSYLIMCRDNATALQWAQSLRDWKKLKGFDVVIEARANWTVTTMTTYIRNAFATWDPPLEFICLIGDPQAAFGIITDTESGGNPPGLDHTFTLGNAGDDLEDIGVGRLSGSSPAQMAVINAKIMNYERDPYMADTTWFTNAVFGCDGGGQLVSSYVLATWNKREFARWTCVRNSYALGPDIGGTGPQVQALFQQGLAYHIWRGSSYDSRLNFALLPHKRLPVAISLTCGTGDFHSYEALSEQFLCEGTAANPRRAVCGIGAATSLTHTAPNNVTVGGFSSSICWSGITHLGHCLNNAKIWLNRTYGLGDYIAQQFSRMANLMGEPALELWTRVPTVMEVDVPETLDLGTGFVSVTVQKEGTDDPVPDALVVLWKGNETYQRVLTDANGQATIPVSVETAGDLLLCVSKNNHKPYLDTLVCAAPAQRVALAHYQIDDDNQGGSAGNGDGMINPGETIELRVWARNFGTSGTGTAIAGTLVSQSPRLTVLQAATTFPDLAPGDSAEGTALLRVQVASGIQHRERALLALNITASSVQTSSSLELQGTAGVVSYSSHVSNPPLGPGVSSQINVTVVNRGATAMTGTMGELVSLSPLVIVTDADGSFGDINPGGTAINASDPFGVTCHATAVRGTQVPLLLIMHCTGGWADTAQVTVTLGTRQASDPLGPDGYGYYAYDNGDDSPLHPTFAYVDISTGLGTNLNIADPGSENDYNTIFSVARPLPFQFRYYGEVFDTITVCSNGWCSLGNDNHYDNWRNYPIPAMQAGGRLIAPYWDDLATTGGAGRGVWVYHDAAEGRYIIQWKAGTANGNYALDFEVILYNEEQHPTLDGNGWILFQYQTVGTMSAPSPDNYDVPGCTVGIQGAQGRVGLGLYYSQAYTPGCATITAGRAILLATDPPQTGCIAGIVRDAGTQAPMADVSVGIVGLGLSVTTDVAGQFYLTELPIGTYSVRAGRRGFNPAVQENIAVTADDTVSVNFSLTHPTLALSEDTVRIVLPDDAGGVSFTVSNGGNGPLPFAIRLQHTVTDTVCNWCLTDSLEVSEETGDMQIYGCEYASGHWWLTGGGGQGGQNMFYLFDRDGNPAGSMPQPSTTNLGWYDLAWDGEHLWGSDGPFLVGVDLAGQPQDSIPSPVNPSRAIAYDPATDHFWVADYIQSIYEIDRTGTVIAEVPNTSGLMITGLAWYAEDELGYNLYIASQDGAAPTRLLQMHPTTHNIRPLTTLRSNPNDRVGGIAIATTWSSTYRVLGAIMLNYGGDRLSIYEAGINTGWMQVTPRTAEVPAGESQVISVTADGDALEEGEHRILVVLHSDVLDTTCVVPVLVTQTSTPAEPGEPAAPAQYALFQNYPNPFNAATVIRYELKAAGRTQLTVYNLVGQEVATLVNGIEQPGLHEIHFDAAALPSGVYFYRFESGEFVRTAKMVLLK